MATYTYPGVYIQEIPSGVHTITGVATSIAAFVGWAAQGPTNQATLVQSWSDFANQFGGLDSRSYLGYAVNQFFANGGQQAYIVRLYSATGTAAVAAFRRHHWSDVRYQRRAPRSQQGDDRHRYRRRPDSIGSEFWRLGR